MALTSFPDDTKQLVDLALRRQLSVCTDVRTGLGSCNKSHCLICLLISSGDVNITQCRLYVCELVTLNRSPLRKRFWNVGGTFSYLLEVIGISITFITSWGMNWTYPRLIKTGGN